MWLERQHASAGQQSGVELEGRIFGRGADEDDGAILHHGQETILLGTIETVDLVDEQQGLPAGHAPCTRRFEHLLEIGNTGEDGGDLLEGESRLPRKQTRDGRLAGAWRSPEDHRSERTRRDHTRQHAIIPGQVLLARDFGERTRAKPVGKRSCGRHLRRLVCCKQIAHRKN
ncbi:hypothetical protein D9M68_525810 [compost metagenome]